MALKMGCNSSMRQMTQKGEKEKDLAISNSRTYIENVMPYTS